MKSTQVYLDHRRRDTMNSLNTGNLISKIRKENNWTQDDLAQQLNISNKTVSKWERGEGLPDVSLLQPLAKVLNISVDELLIGTHEKQEKTDSMFNEDYESPIINKSLRIAGLVVSILILVIYALPIFKGSIQPMFPDFGFDDFPMNFDVFLTMSPYQIIGQMRSFNINFFSFFAGALLIFSTIMTIAFAIYFVITSFPSKGQILNNQWSSLIKRGSSIATLIVSCASVVMNLIVIVLVLLSGLSLTGYSIFLIISLAAFLFINFKIYQEA